MMGFSISSSSEDNVASAVLFTHSTRATPTAFPGLFAAHEKGKALATRLSLPKPISCNQLPRPHDRHSMGKSMSFTRNMFIILTKRILTCLFKKRGVIQHLIHNSPKVTKKVLVFRKYARRGSQWGSGFYG